MEATYSRDWAVFQGTLVFDSCRSNEVRLVRQAARYWRHQRTPYLIPF